MYLTLRTRLLAAYRRALTQALPPKERVARHWVDAGQLTWLGLLSEQTRFQITWSLGELTVASRAPIETAGVFFLEDAVFPGVGADALTREVVELIPHADGATTAFLTRAVAQFALAEVALTLEEDRAFPMPTRADFKVALCLRPDVLQSPASTPRMPHHAEARVREALAAMEPALAVSLTALMASEERSLLEAVRALPSTRH